MAKGAKTKLDKERLKHCRAEVVRSMDEWMSGWMSIWMDDGWMGTWMDGGWMDGCMDGWVHGWMADGWMGEWMVEPKSHPFFPGIHRLVRENSTAEPDLCKRQGQGEIGS